jgi:acyl-CoA dehydrogenase family protein 9
VAGAGPTARNAELPSFVKSLFGGEIADGLVFPYPRLRPTESTALEAWLADLRRFMDAKVDGEAFDALADLPEAVIQGMAEIGLLGLTVPARYDGLGFRHLQAMPVLTEIGTRDAGLGVLLGAHLEIGLGGLLLFGTEEQKRRWIPACARGETLAAFALTEPDHGSDARHIESRALRAPDGRGWILNGRKIWIGNAHRAGLLTVFAQTPVERDGETVDRVTAFAVQGDDEGLKIGRLWKGEKLGIRSSTQAEVLFEDVRLPDDRVIGEVGKGFKIAMHVLNGGRLGLAAFAVGGMRQATEEAAAFAAWRRQFGRAIADFDLIREKLARMRIDAWVAEAMVTVTAELADRGDVDWSLEAAICKVYSSDAAWRAADDALQIAGGRGYMSDRPFERYLRDARILPIFEGTNEVLRLFVGLAGMEPLGERLAGVGRALRDPVQEFGLLSRFAWHRLQDVVGDPDAEVEVAGPLRGPQKVLEQFAGILHGNAARLIQEHGNELPERQIVVARLADVAIESYALTCALARAQAAVETKGEEGAAGEIDLARQYSRMAGARVRVARFQLEDDRTERVRRIGGGPVAERRGARA